ncbi:hypothetical protein IFM47457_10059 [Aspergillus lentulus]|uniref:Uncharacterized protein n=1 Tax=Aspergillus lentulus TaxID=293939 RepID=A0ABQ0ZUB1_ASPLE|nr:hypothetical protein IFM62136_05129 [Aspergillus lentulus]GFF64851.1 hypothetical protein IFM60648_01406 [Aspergillus lentulus]GFF94849.1 hypothetical protein IFM47457_10059 [Aspergillus lentulus]
MFLSMDQRFRNALLSRQPQFSMHIPRNIERKVNAKDDDHGDLDEFIPALTLQMLIVAEEWADNVDWSRDYLEVLPVFEVEAGSRKIFLVFLCELLRSEALQGNGEACCEEFQNQGHQLENHPHGFPDGRHDDGDRPLSRYNR